MTHRLPYTNISLNRISNKCSKCRPSSNYDRLTQNFELTENFAKLYHKTDVSYAAPTINAINVIQAKQSNIKYIFITNLQQTY